MKTKKITAHVPAGVLKEAQRYTGCGVTETVKAGLERLAQALAYERLLGMRGAYHSKADIKKLREDRK